MSKHIKTGIVLIAFFSIAAVFLYSNSVLIFIFESKIWAHRVNSIEKLNKATKLYSGVELDVVYNSQANYFDIHHPPEKPSNLSLKNYFKSQPSSSKCNYWIDFKNLNHSNSIASANRLELITEELDKNSIIVESYYPEILKTFHNKGFLTSYYLPSKLYELDKNDLKIALEEISTKLELSENSYISTNYKNYPIIKESFPESRKIIWFTTYGPMNTVKARFLLYQILIDEKVDVLLLPY